MRSALRWLNIFLLIIWFGPVAVAGVLFLSIEIFSRNFPHLFSIEIREILAVLWLLGGISGCIGIILFLLGNTNNFTVVCIAWGIISYGLLSLGAFWTALLELELLPFLAGLPLFVGIWDLIEVIRERGQPPAS